jgi:DNA-binding transcriptional LysR family regulator
MTFDFRDLEQFVAVAETGSIARAAERCHTVASAVSKRLSDLEDSFGTALLVRGTKGVELTPAGHAFLARARSILHQADQIDEELRRHASGARGHVRVFANISAIVEFLPAALASFLAKYPDISVLHARGPGATWRGQSTVGSLAGRPATAVRPAAGIAYGRHLDRETSPTVMPPSSTTIPASTTPVMLFTAADCEAHTHV